MRQAPTPLTHAARLQDALITAGCDVSLQECVTLARSLGSKDGRTLQLAEFCAAYDVLAVAPAAGTGRIQANSSAQLSTVRPVALFALPWVPEDPCRHTHTTVCHVCALRIRARRAGRICASQAVGT